MPPRRAAAAATADPKGKGKATAGAATAAVVVDHPPPPPAATANTTAPASNTTPRPPPVGQSLFLDTGDDDLSALSSDNEPSFPTHPSNPNIENDNDSDNAELHSDSDDSDPVIKTYDIHLSTTLTPYLHLFQYPVRSTSSPYSRLAGACPSAARIKPTTGVLEVDIPINTDRHYDQEKGRRWGEALRKARIARDARISGGTSSANPSGTSSRGPGKRRRVEQFIDDDDDEDPNDETIFVSFDEAKARGRVLTQQTLGAKLQPDHTRYMIGVFRNIPSTSGGEAKPQLHLTPLKGTLQLRPQFGHIDTANQLDKELQRSLRIIDSSGTGNASSAAPPAARALQASVKNPNEDISGGGVSGGGDGGALRVLRREEGEDWVGMGWVDQDEEAAWEVFEGMFLPGTGADVDEEEREEEREKADVDVDVNMTGIGEDGTHGDKQQEKEKEKLEEKTKKIPTKSNAGPVKLKTVVTGEEYLQLLAAPRIDKDFS